MQSLTAYGNESDTPQLEHSLERKRRFVEEFFITGDIAVAYINAIDSGCVRSQARLLANNLMEGDQFIRDLIGLARKNVIGSVTGLLAEHTSILAELRDGAKNDGKWAPAIAAEIARGKALGLYDRIGVGRTEDKKPEEMSNDELEKLIEAISRLPQAERNNIAQLLVSEVDHDLIEGEVIDSDG